MTSSEIRSQFIRYFVERGHAEVPSSPLIPEKDPTLLFTNAGMVQFKSVFLGEERRPYTRAASSQKCMRAGGKHNDLDNVGQTGRHHTFFEMLGNFSFGDYFKKDAIAYAWELLTEVFQLPSSRLWVTVFRDDDEAAEIWKKHISTDRIVRLGEKDNFWSMGETGPCGPCSEILIDQGEKVHADCPGIGRCDCDRYLEIWNLVFMQYNRDGAGALTPLPKPSIDTGMGLERITAVCQGVLSNYETDLFHPIFKAIAERAGRSEEKVREGMAGRVIADHLRAITFLINDGVIPSNEGRGYVLRRILRRGARFGKQLGFHDPFLHAMTGAVIDTMRGPYPGLETHRKRIEQTVLLEEERFIHTLNQGVQILEEVMAKVKGRGEAVIPGEALFTLYDTYGFPLDLAAEMAQETGLGIDETGFRAAMEVQRERARKSWVGAEGERAEPVYRALREEFGKSAFTGYERLEEEVVLLAILKGGERVASAQGGETVDLIFNPTPFYAEGGGQVGDRGTLSSVAALVEVHNTVKPVPDLHLHRAKVIQGALTAGARYHAAVDAEARKNAARNHTGTHILHAVLRETLGDHVKQAGSLVAPDRLRFDFHHFAPLTDKEIDRIEARVNERIREDAHVETEVMETKEAIAAGATALFGEKYGDRVRVVRVADFSRELCGGTHCHGAGEIGLFKIVKESSVAAGIRRIEALTGPAAYEYIKGQERLLREVSGLLRSRPEEAPQKVESLKAQLQEEKRRAQQGPFLGPQGVEPVSDDLDQVRTLEPAGIKVLPKKLPPMEIKGIREYGDRLRNRLKSGIVIVGAPDPKGEKVSIVAMVTPDWTSRVSAAEIVKEISAIIGGTGGGKPEMAQAGGKAVDRLDAALEKTPEIVEKLVKR